MGICAQYRRRGHQITETVKEIINRNTRLRPEYGRLEPSTDRLFKADVIHDSRGYAEYCMKTPSSVISRRERAELDENPASEPGWNKRQGPYWSLQTQAVENPSWPNIWLTKDYEGLPRSATTCFFSNNQDQNTVRQALCALLHQLFLQKRRS